MSASPSPRRGTRLASASTARSTQPSYLLSDLFWPHGEWPVADVDDEVPGGAIVVAPPSLSSPDGFCDAATAAATAAKAGAAEPPAVDGGQSEGDVSALVQSSAIGIDESGASRGGSGGGGLGGGSGSRVDQFGHDGSGSGPLADASGVSTVVRCRPPSQNQPGAARWEATASGAAPALAGAVPSGFPPAGMHACMCGPCMHVRSTSAVPSGFPPAAHVSLFGSGYTSGWRGSEVGPRLAAGARAGDGRVGAVVGTKQRRAVRAGRAVRAYTSWLPRYKPRAEPLEAPGALGAFEPLSSSSLASPPPPLRTRSSTDGPLPALGGGGGGGSSAVADGSGAQDVHGGFAGRLEARTVEEWPPHLTVSSTLSVASSAVPRRPTSRPRAARMTGGKGPNAGGSGGGGGGHGFAAAARSGSASGSTGAAQCSYGEAESDVLSSFARSGRLLSAAMSADPAADLAALVARDSAHAPLAAALVQRRQRTAAALAAHGTLLQQLRSRLGSIARARRALGDSHTPRAGTASVHTAWLGDSVRARHVCQFAEAIRQLRLAAPAVVEAVDEQRTAAAEASAHALSVVVGMGASARVQRVAAEARGAALQEGREALEALTTARSWLPLPLDVDPMLVAWTDPKQLRPLWAAERGLGLPLALDEDDDIQDDEDAEDENSGAGARNKAGAATGTAPGRGGGASASAGGGTGAGSHRFAPVSLEELPAYTDRRAHSLVQAMRIGAASARLTSELSPSPAAVHAVSATLAALATSATRAPGGECDSAVLVEAELLLYGGAGRYLAARERLASWFERDAAARMVQARALRAMCKPRAGRRLTGSFGRGVAASTIQQWWRQVLAAHPERYPPRPKPKRKPGGSSPKRATYEEIVQRLRMTMCARGAPRRAPCRPSSAPADAPCLRPCALTGALRVPSG